MKRKEALIFECNFAISIPSFGFGTLRSKNKIQTQIFFSLIYSSAGAPSHLAAVSLKKRRNVPRE